jgi:putative ABC transport system substrate-binding protein
MVPALKGATQSIPIVAFVPDPQSTGMAASLSRPDGNLTGIVPDAGLEEVWEKRFELLHEIAPTISTVAIAMPRGEWEGPWGHAVQQAARKARILLSLTALNSLQEAEYRRVFATMRDQGAEGIAIADNPSSFTYRQLIVQLVEDLRLPAVYPNRESVSLGGLVSYSPNLPILFRHAARQVAQILNGTKPGEIPFYRPTKFDLAINLKTAKGLGLTVPQTVLIRADEIIE